MSTGTHSVPGAAHTPAAAHTPDPAAATPHDPSTPATGGKQTPDQSTPASTGSSWKDMASQGVAGGEAAAAGATGALTTEGFLDGMRLLTAETNHVQLVMGQLGLQKMLVEGFARFLKEMGKGFKDLAQ